MKLTQFSFLLGFSIFLLLSILYKSSKQIAIGLFIFPNHYALNFEFHSPLHHKPVTADSATVFLEISAISTSSPSFLWQFNRQLLEMASYLWRKYADYVYTKWERTILWDMIDPYRRPKSFTPLVTIYIAAFYTGVVGAAITEQLYKEKYWEDHPGEAVPLMKPKFYYGPWRVMRGEVPAHTK